MRPRSGLVILLVAGACALFLVRGPAPAGHTVVDSAYPDVSSPGPRAIDPAIFSPGACLAYAPANRSRHETVFLDAGHGGVDPGGVGSDGSGATVEESTVNLPVELDTMEAADREGGGGPGAGRRRAPGISGERKGWARAFARAQPG
jgi:hypothetical protein